MVGILKCYKTALPCTGEMELARFKTCPDCSVAEPQEWCLFSLSWKGGDSLGPSWAVGLGLAEPTNCGFPAALPSDAHSNRFPPVSLVLSSYSFTRTPITQPPWVLYTRTWRVWDSGSLRRTLLEDHPRRRRQGATEPRRGSPGDRALTSR